MKHPLIISLLALFISSCNNLKQQEIKKNEIDKDSLTIDTTAISLKIEGPQNDTLARIESENNASVIASADDVTRAYVDLNSSDSLISLHANMRLDHRIFGYEKPDNRSKKLLLLSIFTNDVKNNPFKLPLGAYYETSGLDEHGLQLKYSSSETDFVQAKLIDATNITEKTLYFEKKWIEIIPKNK